MVTMPAAAAAAEPGRAGSITAPAAVSVSDVVLSALERNRDLRIRRLAPARTATSIDRARAAWDPSVSAEVSTGAGSLQDGTSTRPSNVTLGLSEVLPTGTTIEAQGSTGQTAFPGDTLDRSSTAGINLTVTQSLLRGGSLAANLATLNQAKLDLSISRFEVRGYAQSLVAQAEDAYWTLVLARRKRDIVATGVALARDDLARVDERIRQGSLAASERAATAATLADREAALIEAEAQLDNARFTLWQLLDLPLTAPLPETTTEPGTPDPAELQGVDDHLRVALALRPDLLQAELQRQRGDLDLVQTRNGLLPRLDLFARLGRTGYAESFSGATNADDGLVREATIGLRLSHTFGNRAAEAAERSAEISQEELDQGLANQRELAELDVRKAHREVARVDAQVIATHARTLAREESLRAQRAGFALGRTTAYEVSLADRDRLQALLDEAQAQVTARTARTALHRVDGSLLQRRGIVTP